MAITVKNGKLLVTSEEDVVANYPYYYEVVGYHYDDIVQDIIAENKSDWGFYVTWDAMLTKQICYLHFKTKAQMIYYKMKF